MRFLAEKAVTLSELHRKIWKSVKTQVLFADQDPGAAG